MTDRIPDSEFIGAQRSARIYPSAITGTWDDLERHAWYVYETADQHTSEWELAEATLVLLWGKVG